MNVVPYFQLYIISFICLYITYLHYYLAFLQTDIKFVCADMGKNRNGVTSHLFGKYNITMHVQQYLVLCLLTNLLEQTCTYTHHEQECESQ